MALGFALAMPLSARVAPLPGGEAQALRLGPVGEALRAQLATGADPALAAFYKSRNFRAIWVRGWGLRPDAQAVVEAVTAAKADGLDPAAYDAAGLTEVMAAASSHAPADLARAEIALSRAASAYLSDLHAPKPGAEMVYADPAVAPPRPDRVQALQILARAPSPAEGLEALQRMNPLYVELRATLAVWRAKGGDAATAARLRANLERARALPPDPGPRYILVDAAAQTLWLYEGGRPVDSMAVVVGKVSEPTPVMAGLVRYAVARPYWNVPPDLVRNSIAPQVLRQGPAYLASQNMEVLSGWTDDAAPVDPEAVDWAAVAAGRQVVRVRQRPGPNNMMGQVKFVFPNGLGVYLHDSPLRQYFAARQRTESAGCVRLSDAPRLARWLLGEDANLLGQGGEPETRIDLVSPIPVFIVYFTAMPQVGGLSLRTDIYHRDPALEAHLSDRA